MLRAAALALAGLTLCGALASCGGSSARPSSLQTSAPGRTLHVGYIVPLTGPFATLGESTEQGWEAGVAVYGKKVDGVTIKTDFVDDAGSVATGLSVAQRLVQADHVSLVEGPILANVDEAVSRYLGPLRVPLVDLCACSSTQIDNYYKYGNAFASSSTADQTATYAARYMSAVEHHSHITVVAMDYAFGWEVVGSFAKEFEHLGGKLDKVIWAPVNATDMSSYVSQIPSNTSAVALLIIGSLAVDFLKDYGSFGITAPLFGITGLTTDQATLPAEPSSAVTGLTSSSWYCDGATNNENTRFVQAFERLYHKVPGYYAEAAFDKYHELTAAVAASHGKVSSKTAMLTALRSAETVPEPRGAQRLNTRADSPTQDVSICRVETVHGVLRNVPIATYKSAPPWGLLSYQEWWSLFQHDSFARPKGL